MGHFFSSSVLFPTTSTTGYASQSSQIELLWPFWRATLQTQKYHFIDPIVPVLYLTFFDFDRNCSLGAVTQVFDHFSISIRSGGVDKVPNFIVG